MCIRDSYVIEHYQNPSLTLKEVADYVDLSEKYFTTKFTKECGETFLSYLTGLRIQKAKELIKTTTFKMYEIAEMVGYNNPEPVSYTHLLVQGHGQGGNKLPVDVELHQVRGHVDHNGRAQGIVKVKMCIRDSPGTITSMPRSTSFSL